jgi:hypothetical protein
MNTKLKVALGVLAGLLAHHAVDIGSYNLAYKSKANLGDFVGFRTEDFGVCVGTVAESVDSYKNLKKQTTHMVAVICEKGMSLESVSDSDVIVLRYAE